MKKSTLVLLALSASLLLQNCKKEEESPAAETKKTVAANYAPDNTLIFDSVPFPLTNIVAQPVFEDYYVEVSFLFQQATSVLIGKVGLYFDSTTVAPADGMYTIGSNTKQQSNIALTQMDGRNAELYVAQSGKLNVDIVGGKKRYRVTDALFKQASGTIEKKASFSMVED